MGNIRTVSTIAVVVVLVSLAHAAGDVVSAVHGLISDIDTTTKTIGIKTSDGVDHSVHFTERTVVHGGALSQSAAKASWHGIARGDEVVVHLTDHGTRTTAVEVDRIGKDGLKSVDGTVREIDRTGRRLVLETDDGAESVFRMTGQSTIDSGKDIAKGASKGSRITVYYTEDVGKKVAHFFEAI
jgi:phosphotransferase system IIA component